jgi:hypothetical protein
MFRTLTLFAALFAVTAIQTAQAQDITNEGTLFSGYDQSLPESEPEDDTNEGTLFSGYDQSLPESEPEDDTNFGTEELDEFDVDGRYIYLVCIYGPRDSGLVPRKCADIKAKLRTDYRHKRVIRIDNPSEERLERIKEHQKDNIAFIIVVTHSTPGPTDEDWDVWDTEIDPVDFAECFHDEFIIWNGCYSRAICEQGDNILPVQCDEDFLPVGDDTWRKIARCLFGTDEAVTQEDVCEEVFGEDWKNREDDDK